MAEDFVEEGLHKHKKTSSFFVDFNRRRLLKNDDDLKSVSISLLTSVAEGDLICFNDKKEKEGKPKIPGSLTKKLKTIL